MSNKEKIRATDKIPDPIGPYSQGIRVENPGTMIFVSGQIPNDPKTGQIKGGIKDQTMRALKNVEAVLEESGATFDDVVKVIVQLNDMEDYEPMNEVYSEFFDEPKPVRTCSTGLNLANGSRIEIYAIAIK